MEEAWPSLGTGVNAGVRSPWRVQPQSGRRVEGEDHSAGVRTPGVVLVAGRGQGLGGLGRVRL